MFGFNIAASSAPVPDGLPEGDSRQAPYGESAGRVGHRDPLQSQRHILVIVPPFKSAKGMPNGTAHVTARRGRWAAKTKRYGVLVRKSPWLAGGLIYHLAIEFRYAPRDSCKKQRTNQYNQYLETSVSLAGFPTGDDLGHCLLLSRATANRAAQIAVTRQTSAELGRRAWISYLANDEHRNFGVMHNLRRLASEQKPSYPASSVRGHDNEVAAAFRRIRHDRVGRRLMGLLNSLKV